jgi:diguanylate cyclase (GGDEF)-like protein/PAS domain S-box-containing protein
MIRPIVLLVEEVTMSTSQAYRVEGTPPDTSVVASRNGVTLNRIQTWLVRGAAAWAGVMGAMVLADWWVAGDLLTALLPTAFGRTRPLTAVIFLAMAVGLLALLHQVRPAVYVAAGVVGGLGVVVVAEYVTNRDTGLDRLLFGDAVLVLGGPHPGRMALLTALSSCVIAAALVCCARRRLLIAQACALVVLATSGLAFLGYLYGSRPILTISGFVNIAAYTAVTLTVVSGALLGLTAGRGLLTGLSAPAPAGVLVRHLLPATIAVLVVLVFLDQWGERAGWYDSPLGSALVVSVGTVLLTAVVLWTARELAGMDEERAAAVRSLQALNEGLDEEVQLRTAALEAQTAERTRAEQLVDALFESVPDNLCVIDDGGYFVRLNPQWERTLGWTSDELRAVPVFDFIHPDDREATRALLRSREDGGATVIGYEDRYRCRDGSYRSLLWNAVRLSDRGVFVCNARDITDRKELERELTQRALFDGLTGLANRYLALDHLGLALDQQRRDGGNVVLVYLDVDRFKHINDTYGHQSGDAVLQAIGERLRSAVRTVDTAARLAGDEFVVLCPHVESASAALPIVERIRDAVNRPVDIDGREVDISMSIGVALAVADMTVDDLLHAADSAMYQAKRQGGNRWEIYGAAPVGETRSV